jgi:hypothetical protein
VAEHDGGTRTGDRIQVCTRGTVRRFEVELVDSARLEHPVGAAPDATGMLRR